MDTHLPYLRACVYALLTCCKVKAKDGRAVRIPKKRWVVLRGGGLAWYPDSREGVESSQQSLQGAAASMPLRETGYAMTPAMCA